MIAGITRLAVIRFLFLLLTLPGAESYAQGASRDFTYAEKAFLNCSLQCDSEIEKGSIFRCLDNCQKTTGIPPASITRIMSMKIGNGVTEEECSTFTSFVCPVVGDVCCCEGVFDCKKMEEVVKGCEIDVCEHRPDNREICTCRLKK